MNRITQEAYKRQAVVKTAQRKGKTYASRMYGVSLSSVKRWCRRYDGSWQSLKEKSHRPNSHPRQHTAREEEMIREAVRQSYFRYGWEGAYIHYHAVIYQALKYAMKTDMVPQNVAMKVDRPRKNSFQPTFLDAEQMQKLFEVVKGTRLELPVLVAAFYGLRRGEVLGLRWDAIDFNRGTLTIKRPVTEATIDGKCEIVCADRAKTKSSLRSLPLVSSIREKLLALREQQKENRRVCGKCYSKKYDGYVFVDAMGNIFNPRSVTANFSKLLEQNGLRHIRFHDLRHSCASLLLANDVPLKQIQEWLGHSDIGTTANIYSHLDYKSKITSANVMDNILTLPDTGQTGWHT